ncbi:MAG: alpha/beta hydrolase fold domain-containing protein [Flavobacteriales bacterium]
MRFTIAPFLLLLHPLGVTQAQNCSYDYTTRQFDVQVESGILYGVAQRFNGGTDSLRLNLYKPIGDGITQRPLFIAVHGGAFIGGDRNELNELCRWYAERGYVAATVSYRLGFYAPPILSNPYAYDQAEVIRAAYRAQQDVKGAIRFLRARSVVDSTDVDNVSICGVSAGAITAMHVAYATADIEKPEACNAIAAVNHILVQYARPDLGPIDGELNPGPSAAVNACVAYFGGILDTAMIDGATDPALFTYHQTGDPVVGCGYQQALWGVPLGLGANYPWLFGSCALDPHMQQLGYGPDRYEFHPHTGNAHDIHDLPLVDGWAAEFLARQFCDPTTTVAAERTMEVRIHPNPAQDRIQVDIPGEHVIDLTLMDPAGRSLRTVRGHTMDLSGLAGGVHLLRINGASGSVVRRVIILD